MDIKLNLITYGLIELCIVLIIIIAVLLFKLNKFKQHYLACSNLTKTPLHNTKQYFQQELNKLNNFLASSIDSNSKELDLRQALLQMELKLLKANSEINNWMELSDEIHGILKNTGFIQKTNLLDNNQSSPPDPEQEEQPSAVLFEQQTKTITHLRKFIENLLKQINHEPTPVPEIEQHFNELQQTNQELECCIAIIEEDNKFLRDQISALLKLDKEDI